MISGFTHVLEAPHHKPVANNVFDIAGAHVIRGYGSGGSAALEILHFIRRSRPQSKTMSLPPANYDPRRVCVNPCPNVSLGLGKNKRTVGVYLAGALVRSPPLPIHKRIPNSELTSNFSSVLSVTHVHVCG